MYMRIKELIGVPPLIIRVNVPNSTLDKNLVFIHGDEKTERERGEFLGHDNVRWAIPWEELGVQKKSCNSHL